MSWTPFWVALIFAFIGGLFRISLGADKRTSKKKRTNHNKRKEK